MLKFLEVLNGSTRLKNVDDFVVVDFSFVPAVFNTSRHSSTNNRNRIRQPFSFFTRHHSPVSRLLGKGHAPKICLCFVLSYVLSCPILTFSVIGSCVRTPSVSFDSDLFPTYKVSPLGSPLPPLSLHPSLLANCPPSAVVLVALAVIS